MKKLFILILITFITISCTEKKVVEEEKTMTFDIPKKSVEVKNLGYITVNKEKTELSGVQLKVGDTLQDAILDKKAPYFDQVKTTSLADFSDYKVIETVPSLDTPVCTMQTKQLEFAAKKFSKINFLVISNDTPFALERFCAANKIKNLQVLSDARTREFGEKNSLLMKKYSLLARTIMIVDKNNKIIYIEYANEVTKELDLMNAFAKLNEILAEKK